MMTELMLRLLKDGKIVGYELIARNNHYQAGTPQKGIEYARRNKDVDYIIEWDAFELGIKIGETWFFDGDICEENAEEGTVKLFLRYEQCTWFVDYDEAGSYPLDEVLNTAGVWYYPTKLIGNIHEEAK